jgi:hypothetical protein
VYAEGMQYVLIGGRFLVRDGKLLEGATPGQPVRAPIAP